VKLLKGKRLKSVLVAGFSGGACSVVYFPVPGQHQFGFVERVQEGNLPLGVRTYRLGFANGLD
jgi:hypothetical protein